MDPYSDPDPNTFFSGWQEWQNTDFIALFIFAIHFCLLAINCCRLKDLDPDPYKRINPEPWSPKSHWPDSNNAEINRFPNTATFDLFRMFSLFLWFGKFFCFFGNPLIKCRLKLNLDPKGVSFYSHPLITYLFNSKLSIVWTFLRCSLPFCPGFFVFLV